MNHGASARATREVVEALGLPGALVKGYAHARAGLFLSEASRGLHGGFTAPFHTRARRRR